MQVNATTTLRISFTWNERAKAWDIHGSGGDGKHTWIVTKRVESTAELDRSASALLIEQCAFALQSWLF